ncbi:hypothetical protein DIZ81_06085 [Legionella taurinensis]|uniref:Uncharacterized protein n=1 Tax=Legionella taurinensis TaxID=70611 RepID=A0A3A5LJA1_9GAMM|nr:hypothetical protein [Legionella taurinensis]MDX1837486.1 hypothetical protein [Legionella taurinensis]PUT40828.1 hypothetical protein DB744_06085 [Legionella taurinensis]PUT44249.1 hypothetical protein DB746_04485 [Legionella taurinensis]PUT47551.1 hypothetical protein DB743_02655 [Legionella taurinensis]PUT48690.1 hypothetical protein DB745_04485 [Legionella taurinensis]
MDVPALQAVLHYQNPTVVRHFAHHHPEFNLKASQQLFSDLLAWLWLNAYRQKTNRHTYFFGPLLPLDAMWHTFILHTRDYTDFCQAFFNAYFHHEVEPPGEEHQLTPDELADFLTDCYDHLGEAWVNRYFSEALEPFE